jgi:lipopolysaccharide export system permease protein
MVLGPTLMRYFASRVFKTTIGMFMSVFFLILTLDFVELMRRAGDSPIATTRLMVQLALYRTPTLAEYVIPFAILFGGMITLLALSRKLELVIARAAGVSAWQFLVPAVAVAGALGVVSVAAYNPVAAELKQRAAALEASIFARSGTAANSKDIWLRQKGLDGSSIMRATSAIEGGSVVTQPTFFLFDKDEHFLERIEAREAILKDGYWELKDARLFSVNAEPQSHASYQIATSIDAEQVRQTFTPPESVPFWELTDAIARTERAGLDATKYRLHYQTLLSRPLLLIAMVLVAASVSLRFFRFGGIAKMVLAGVISGFVLYVVMELTESLGAAGMIRPVVAAWLPAILGIMFGVLALLHQEDG